MMALFEARGLIGIGDTIFSEGLLGSGQFEGRLIGETTIGPFRAVNPVVGGSAKVLGYTKWVVDPTDALGLGLVVA